MIAISCATEYHLVGLEPTPGEEVRITLSAELSDLRVDGAAVPGRRIRLAPGRVRLALNSKSRPSSRDRGGGPGFVLLGQCETTADLEPGQAYTVSNRLERTSENANRLPIMINGQFYRHVVELRIEPSRDSVTRFRCVDQFPLPLPR